jgi:NAD(P)-dependent dehydrogenase (short-subunit alcohol dehydrogenase family)
MILADLADVDQVMTVVSSAEAHIGRVDILVNAVWLTERGNLLHTASDLFDRNFAVNVREDLHRFCSVQVLMSGGPLLEGYG